MNARNTPDPATARLVVRWTLVGAVVVLGLLGFFFQMNQQYSGYAVVAEADGTLVEADLLEATTLVLGSYTDLVSLILASFGAVAFLVTYRQQQGAVLTGRAWALLAAGIILLAGGLILCLFGREVVLTMIGHNAVELSLPALAFGRWATYLCVVLAAILIGFFAAEVALSPDRPASDGHSPAETEGNTP